MGERRGSLRSAVPGGPGVPLRASPPHSARRQLRRPAGAKDAAGRERSAPRRGQTRLPRWGRRVGKTRIPCRHLPSTDCWPRNSRDGNLACHKPPRRQELAKPPGEDRKLFWVRVRSQGQEHHGAEARHWPRASRPAPRPLNPRAPQGILGQDRRGGGLHQLRGSAP